jgi:molybdopterin synthase catalytic subunit/molybdopterin converting factor small subunit
MRIRVLFFGMLKDMAGRGADSLELPEGATVGDLLAHYSTHIPRLAAYAPSLALSVNQEYASAGAALHDNDEVGLLPPVSGGAEADKAPKPRVAIVHTPIDIATLVQTIKRPGDGAVVVFEGIVRDHSRGRRTLYLEYEGYEPMARKQLEALATDALAKFAIDDVVIVHRLGRLEIGEASVLIAVSAAHRGAAFDACRWAIDTLKKTVPIWKKEYFADGAVWADGEPFPPEITSGNSSAAETERRSSGEGKSSV